MYYYAPFWKVSPTTLHLKVTFWCVCLPGSTVVKTLGFQCRGAEDSIPGWELRSHRLWDRHGQKYTYIWLYIISYTLVESSLSVAVKNVILLSILVWATGQTSAHVNMVPRGLGQESPGFCGTVSGTVGMSDTHGFLAQQARVMVLWDSGRWQMMLTKVMQGTICVASPCVFSHHSQGLKEDTNPDNCKVRPGLQQEQGMSLPQRSMKPIPLLQFLGLQSWEMHFLSLFPESELTA